MRRYATVDVFTETPFGGNPLAVVLDAAGLTAEQMQALAREFNYSETTFVLPPADPAHTARVRIFTPGSELPFAGHPNVGTAYVLASRNPGLPETLLFEERAGLVPVRVLRDGGKVTGAELTAPEALSVRAAVPADEVAACLGLAAGDLRTDAHEPTVVSVGLPFLVAELAGREALARARVDAASFGATLPRDGANAVYVYCREADGSLQARMFSPLDGIGEDPATGSAAAAVSAFLASLRQTDVTLRIGQGADMGRPSQLTARVVQGKAHVGGACVALMEGMISLP